MRTLLAIILGLASFDAAKPQPPRWRSVRHAAQKVAEKTGVRWAMPATIQRKVFLEIPDTPAADDFLQRIAKEAGLVCETLNGVRVLHRPEDAELDRLTQAAKGSLDAIARLGWSRDARAWPVLAAIAAGNDVAPALAAAQALRRLEGEKALDWRLFGVSHEDSEFVSMTQEVAPWQAPLGLAFPGRVPAEAVERLAGSTYLPLREAAARLAAGLGEKGKGLAARLAEDRSPLVAAAGKRTLQAWAQPQKASAAEDRKPPQEIDLKAAAEELKKATAHDTVHRGIGRRLAQQGTPEALRVLLDYGKSGAALSHHTISPLAYFAGGPDTLAHLRSATTEKASDGGAQGPSLWGLAALLDGEELAAALQPLLGQEKAHWASPPEYTAARGAGIHAVNLLLPRMEKRGHWVCRALGYIGGPEAVTALIAQLGSPDAGVAVAAAKGLGDTSAHAAISPLIAQLRHEDRLRRHWAVLGLGRIGGPEAIRALEGVLKEEERRKDRLVRKAAAELLREMGPLSPEAQKLVTAVEEEDKKLTPEYRPRNKRFAENFPENTEVTIPEHAPKTYSSVGETRQAMDWANRLMFRYGGCTGCYSNEFFAFDVGTATWFPVRAADHYEFLFNEVRPNAGCSRAMCFDGTNKVLWIGPGIGSQTGPHSATHNLSAGLTAYDAALDRFVPCANSLRLPSAYSGEPDKAYVFDSEAGLVIGSKSGAKGVAVIDVRQRTTELRKGPEGMPVLDHYPPPALAYDPVAKVVMGTHPGTEWKLVIYDARANTFRSSDVRVPGRPNIKDCGGLVYDSLNREMILVGGKGRGEMPVCRYDRETGAWVDLQAKDIGKLKGGDGHTVYDPEHNVFLGLGGGAYRYKNVPVGTRAFHGGNP